MLEAHSPHSERERANIWRQLAFVPILFWQSFGMQQRSSLIALVLIAKHICQKSSVNKKRRRAGAKPRNSHAAHEKVVTSRWQDCCRATAADAAARNNGFECEENEPQISSTRNNNKRFFFRFLPVGVEQTRHRMKYVTFVGVCVLFFSIRFLEFEHQFVERNIGIEDEEEDAEKEEGEKEQDDEGWRKKKFFECVKKYGKLNNRNHMIVYRSQNERNENKYVK